MCDKYNMICVIVLKCSCRWCWLILWLCPCRNVVNFHPYFNNQNWYDCWWKLVNNNKNWYKPVKISAYMEWYIWKTILGLLAHLRIGKNFSNYFLNQYHYMLYDFLFFFYNRCLTHETWTFIDHPKAVHLTLTLFFFHV